MPARDIISSLEALVQESHRLLAALKADYPAAPYDKFERALLDLDSFLPSEKVRSGSGDSWRLRKNDMVVGRKYRLMSPSFFVPKPFVYYGSSGSGSGDFCLVWIGSQESCSGFYADFGIEPYNPGDTNEWWHDNWVEEIQDFKEVIQRALNAYDPDDADMGFEEVGS